MKTPMLFADLGRTNDSQRPARPSVLADEAEPAGEPPARGLDGSGMSRLDEALAWAAAAVLVAVIAFVLGVTVTS